MCQFRPETQRYVNRVCKKASISSAKGIGHQGGHCRKSDFLGTTKELMARNILKGGDESKLGNIAEKLKSKGQKKITLKEEVGGERGALQVTQKDLIRSKGGIEKENKGGIQYWLSHPKRAKAESPRRAENWVGGETSTLSDRGMSRA